jgi:hypothetical protein
MTTRTFNADDSSHDFYKILRRDMIHHGFKYVEGLNVDHHRFDPTGTCRKGGLYFSDKEHIIRFLEYGTTIANVNLPKDARVVQEDYYKWKADKIILSNIQPIEDWEMWNDSKFCLTAVHQSNRVILQFVKKQTPKICLAAVRQDGLALQFVKDQTPEICLAAVRQDEDALQYVK